MTSEAYDYFRAQGIALAGEPGDLSLRANLYHRMYRESGKRNVFALIAAHGTLWAAGYLKTGILGAWLLSLPYIFTPRLRREKLRSVAAFAHRFRDINRRVCVESYAIYHYTRHFGATPFIRSVIGNGFAQILCECHASCQSGSDFTSAQRERLFSAFFHWEQDNIVAPLVSEAFATIDWPVIKSLALRPAVDFTYFGKSLCMRFVDFSSKDERVLQGLRAYRMAEEAGFDVVEQCLGRYVLTPFAFDRASPAKDMSGALSWSALKPARDSAAVPRARTGKAYPSKPAHGAAAWYC